MGHDKFVMDYITKWYESNYTCFRQIETELMGYDKFVMDYITKWYESNLHQYAT